MWGNSSHGKDNDAVNNRWTEHCHDDPTGASQLRERNFLQMMRGQDGVRAGGLGSLRLR